MFAYKAMCGTDVELWNKVWNFSTLFYIYSTTIVLIHHLKYIYRTICCDKIYPHTNHLLNI